MTQDTQTDANYRADNGQLRAFVERRERLEAEKQDAADAIKELNAEIKSFGYDLPTFNKAIARRKLDRDTVAEQDATLEMYETALEGK